MLALKVLGAPLKLSELRSPRDNTENQNPRCAPHGGKNYKSIQVILQWQEANLNFVPHIFAHGFGASTLTVAFHFKQLSMKEKRL
eukprot:417638-Amphidinium_carterae.1